MCLICPKFFINTYKKFSIFVTLEPWKLKYLEENLGGLISSSFEVYRQGRLKFLRHTVSKFIFAEVTRHSTIHYFLPNPFNHRKVQK